MAHKLVWGLFIVVFLLFSCAGSKKSEDIFAEPSQEEQAMKNSQQDDLSELEELLGIKREKKPENKTEEPAPSEIQLLGADEGKGAKKDMAAGTSKQEQPMADARLINLQKENENLRQQVRQKDQKIRELESQMEFMKDEISRLTSKPAVSAPVQSVTPSTDYVSPQGDYRAIYEQALSYFNQKNYDAALNLFQQLLKMDSNHELADNAQYWIGECHYLQGKYQQALSDFEKVFTYPKSNKNDYAQFKIALCYLRLGQRDRAREELQRFLDEYPKSGLRSRAQDLLSRL